MIDYKEPLTKYLVAVKIDLERALQPFSASGFSRNSLRIVANQFLKAELRGANYIQYQIKSLRTPKPEKVGRTFVDNIKQWMYYRGITPQRNGKILPNTETNITRTAFGIAWGIVQKGTPFSRNEKGINLDKILKDNNKILAEGIGGKLVASFTDKLTIKT